MGTWLRSATILGVAALVLTTASYSTPRADGFQPDNPDTVARKILEAAGEYSKEKDWKPATDAIQKVLKMPNIRGSIHEEAESLLRDLPADGREWYRQTYGPEAKDLLKDALAKQGVAGLKKVVHDYLYTDSGPVALEALAHHFRGIRLSLAAPCYKQ